MECGRLQEAVRAFVAAARKQPDWWRPHHAIGVLCLEHLDRRKRGLRHLGRALELKPPEDIARQIEALIQDSGGTEREGKKRGAPLTGGGDAAARRQPAPPEQRSRAQAR